MELSLDSLPLDEALRYMGCPAGFADAATLALAEQAAAQVLAAARPKWLFRTFSLLPDADGVVLDCGLTLPGGDLAAHLQGCDRAVLFCVTLSAQVDLLLRQAGARDMALALALDACATAAIEAVCDRAEALIQASFPDCFFPFRFSPGYGDLPLTLQGPLLDLLDAPHKIGLCATSSSILTPRKSVTALLGVSRGDLPARPGGCAACTRRGQCQFQCKEDPYV